MPLAGTLVYFVAWFERFYEPAKLIPTVGFATLFFVGFAALAVFHARRVARSGWSSWSWSWSMPRGS